MSGEAWIDGVTFNWTDNADDEDYYLIEWSSDESEWFAIDEVDAGETSYTDAYPTFGVNWFRVVAVRGYELILSAASTAISVTPKAPPVAWHDDNAGANERGTLSPFHVVHDDPNGVIINVVPNDVDYDSGTVHIPSNGFTQPGNGTVTLDAQTGKFTYIPDAGFAGTDTFTYWVVDGDGTPSAPATVAVDVTNTLPSPKSQEVNYYGVEQAQFLGQTYEWGHIGQLVATDADGDTLTYEVADDVSHGTLVIDPATGQFVYVPDAQSFMGTDRFTFTVNDGTTAPDDPPVASVVITSYHQLTVVAGYVPTSLAWFWYQNMAMKFTSLPSSGTLMVHVMDPEQPSWQTAETGVWYPEIADASYVAPPGSSGWPEVQFTYVTRNGPFTSKPATLVLDRWGGLGQHVASVSNDQPTTRSLGGYIPAVIDKPRWAYYDDDDHDFVAPESGFSLTLGQNAQHGTVSLNGNDTFTYTPPPPDSITGEPYVGWDFFSFTTSSPERPSVEHWVQLQVGDYPPPPPIIVQPRSDWVSQPFDGTLNDLYEKVGTVEQKRNAVLHALADLGEAWQPIAVTEDGAEEVLELADDAIDALDTAQSAYLTYLDAWLELNGNAASYQSTWQAYFDNWWDPDTYSMVLMGVQALPRDIGGLEPNEAYMQKITDALNEFGDAAGFQSNLAGTVFTVAEGAHAVLERAEYGLALTTGGDVHGRDADDEGGSGGGGENHRPKLRGHESRGMDADAGDGVGGGDGGAGGRQSDRPAGRNAGHPGDGGGQGCQGQGAEDGTACVSGAESQQESGGPAVGRVGRPGRSAAKPQGGRSGRAGERCGASHRGPWEG